VNSTISISPTAAESFHPNSTSLRRGARFTQTGDVSLEKHLASVCEEVGKGVRATVPAALLEGLLLGGGYGRGEGGVLSSDFGDAPYNDMEFYVFMRGSTILNDRLYKKALHHLGESLSEMAGLEVEFKILSLAGLRRSAVTMFSYDFVTGHRWVIGDDELFTGCAHHRQADAIPQHEATRLLFNRCTGLLYAKERLLSGTFTADDSDFVVRNLAKVQLAMGDALLASQGQYHWSCQERHHRLNDITPTAGIDLALIKKHHTAGVLFKLHPRHSSLTREQLSHKHQGLCELASQLWLALESARIGKPFADMASYRNGSINKCPDQPAWRNRLVNARRSGFGALLSPSSARYPRERLFHALTLLLWGDINDSWTLAAAQRELHTQESTFTGLVGAYQTLWSHFN